MLLHVVNLEGFALLSGNATRALPMKIKQPKAPERVGLSLHKHLVPHVVEKAPVLGMNPNEFVNTCVEDCVNGMLQKGDPGPGAPWIVTEYRKRAGIDAQPTVLQLSAAQFALVRALDEVIQDFTVARAIVQTGGTPTAVLGKPVIELVREYRRIRERMLNMAESDKPPASS